MRLWLVRHGQSAGNVAAAAAEQQGRARVALDVRDADVPLSPLGGAQATTLGRWFASGAAGGVPDVLLASPYARARQTAEAIRAAGGAAPGAPLIVDERLREREFGMLDGLTPAGVARLFPDQAAAKALLGKFYHRPPGGESWCDVILRLRSVLHGIRLQHDGARVLVVTHQVVVLCLRYILEDMDEATILAIDAADMVANCSLTEYRRDAARDEARALVLTRFNDTAPLSAHATQVTIAPDPIAGARG